MQGKWCYIQWQEGGEQGPVDPGYGGGTVPGHPSTGPIYGGGYPSHGLPGIPAYPSQGLPGGGHISLLPVFPFDPTLKPDNELPSGPPEHPSHQPIQPGTRLVVKWLCGAGLIAVPEPK